MEGKMKNSLVMFYIIRTTKLDLKLVLRKDREII